MFAPTTNKIGINAQPSAKIGNMNKGIRVPTTITAHSKSKYGRDTATSPISMNFDPQKNHFGFNQEYLKPTNNKRPFGFQPLYAKVGDSEVPLEDSLVVDPKRVKDITMQLSKELDDDEIRTPLTSPLFHYDKETNMIQTVDKLGQSIQVDINEMPQTLQEKILDIEERAVNKLNDALENDSQDTPDDNVYLDPWVYVEEKEKHEIVEMTLSHLENAKDTKESMKNTDNKDQTEIELADDDMDKMPLPKYFQDLYAEFGSLKEFDLKEVIYEKKEQERFMGRVRKEIENKQSLTKLKKREIWRVIKESKFPIMLGVLVTVEGTIEVCAGALQLSAISYLRTGIYIKMTQEGLKRGATVVKNDKTQKQYQEVADELQNLKSIICSVADLENSSKIEGQISEKFKDKQFGHTLSNQKSPWWWPFM